jgi:hypothetical protein
LTATDFAGVAFFGAVFALVLEASVKGFLGADFVAIAFVLGLEADLVVTELVLAVFAAGLEPGAVLMLFGAGAADFVFVVCDTFWGLGLVDFAVTLGEGEAFLAVAEFVLPLGFLGLGVDINPQQVGSWSLLISREILESTKQDFRAIIWYAILAVFWRFVVK